MTQDHSRCDVGEPRVGGSIRHTRPKRVLSVLVGLIQVLSQGSIEIESAVLYKSENTVGRPAYSEMLLQTRRREPALW